MGRPKLEKATASTKRIQKFHWADYSKIEKENLRRKVCRNKKVANLTAEELEERRYDRERKARSRQNALLNSSRQKLVCLRIKERNRKANHIEQSTPLDFSTP